MGYNVDTTDVNFIILQENLYDAYRAMCDLNKDDSQKMGGSLGQHKNTEDIANSNSVSTNPNKWFSWMSWNYDEICEDSFEIFSELGFEVDEDCNGDLLLVGYRGKSGQVDVFLDAVAPYVEPGSYIDWMGEDGYLFRNEFDGKKMEVKEGLIQWVPVNRA